MIIINFKNLLKIQQYLSRTFADIATVRSLYLSTASQTGSQKLGEKSAARQQNGDGDDDDDAAVDADCSSGSVFRLKIFKRRCRNAA